MAVTHGGLMKQIFLHYFKELLARLDGNNNEQAQAHTKINLDSVNTKLGFDNLGHFVLRFNHQSCTVHLYDVHGFSKSTK